MATRPSSVPATAEAIPPSNMIPGGIPPGSELDPQFLAVQQFQNTVAHTNSQAANVYVRALSDWQQNVQQCEAYNLPTPPKPNPPNFSKANVVYATADGTVQDTYGPAMWAYMWES